MPSSPPAPTSACSPPSRARLLTPYEHVYAVPGMSSSDGVAPLHGPRHGGRRPVRRCARASPCCAGRSTAWRWRSSSPPPAARRSGSTGLEAGLDQRLRFLTAGGPRRRSPPLAAQRHRVELRPARRRRPRPAAHGQRVRLLVRRRRRSRARRTRHRGRRRRPRPAGRAEPAARRSRRPAPATAPWSRSASSASSSWRPPTPSRRSAPATCGGAGWCCARSTRATGGRPTTSGARRSTPWSTTSGRRSSFAESDDVRAGATADLAAAFAHALYLRGRPTEAQRRFEQAAAATPDPAGRPALLRLAAGAACSRYVGLEALALLQAAADLAIARGDDGAAAYDLAAMSTLVSRCPGIMSEAPTREDALRPLEAARHRSDGSDRATAAIATATVHIVPEDDPASPRLAADGPRRRAADRRPRAGQRGARPALRQPPGERRPRRRGGGGVRARTAARRRGDRRQHRLRARRPAPDGLGGRARHRRPPDGPAPRRRPRRPAVPPRRRPPRAGPSHQGRRDGRAPRRRRRARRALPPGLGAGRPIRWRRTSPARPAPWRWCTACAATTSSGAGGARSPRRCAPVRVDGGRPIWRGRTRSTVSSPSTPAMPAAALTIMDVDIDDDAQWRHVAPGHLATVVRRAVGRGGGARRRRRPRRPRRPGASGDTGQPDRAGDRRAGGGHRARRPQIDQCIGNDVRRCSAASTSATARANSPPSWRRRAAQPRR